METNKKFDTSILAGHIFVIMMGLLSFGAGAGLSYKQYRMARDGAEAQREVIDLLQDCDDDGCTYGPVVRFRSMDRRIVTYVSNYSSSPPEYKVGDVVTVIYMPDDPQNAVIKGEGKPLRKIFNFVGGAVIIGGVVYHAKELEGNIPAG